jgi:hypothetical protein
VAGGDAVTSPDRRRELRETYEQRSPQAGVYALRNTVTGRTLVASAPDLDAVRNRLDFARATNSVGALDGRLASDIREHGMDAIVFEVLDTLTVAPGTTPDRVRADLAELERLWREKLAADPQV